MFLAGDSAHAFPPSGGFGLNTGIGDAFNLGHKLSAGINSSTGSLYHSERHHVGSLTKEFSIINYQKSLEIAKKLRLDASHADLFTSLVGVVGNATGVNQKALLHSGMGLGLNIL